jgi:hypothetical protein
MLHIALDPQHSHDLITSLVDSIHRMESIVALLEQYPEVPPVRRFECGSVLQQWLTPWQLQV